MVPCQLTGDCPSAPSAYCSCHLCQTNQQTSSCSKQTTQTDTDRDRVIPEVSNFNRMLWRQKWQMKFNIHDQIQFVRTLSCPNEYFSHMGHWGHLPQVKSAAWVQQSHYPTLINYKVHAGSLCVSITHQTLAWTTGSLKCIYVNILKIIWVRMYTHGGWAYQQWISTIILTWKNSHKCCLYPWRRRVQTLSLWISSPTLYHPGPMYISTLSPLPYIMNTSLSLTQ